jgi:hypothetical protein
MNIFREALDFYKQNSTLNERPTSDRIDQLVELTDILETHFHFENVISIETGTSYYWWDGMVGAYFAYLAHLTNGSFTSVDIDPSLNIKAKNTYNNLTTPLSPEFVTQDSVSFLKNTELVPNLVHLDSWDLNLKDPYPSALHGWREFEAIENKMPIGSILVIDDNYYGGTWVTYTLCEDKDPRKILSSERIDITNPIIGKGAHIYQETEAGRTNWKIVGKKWGVGNTKIILKKIK